MKFGPPENDENEPTEWQDGLLFVISLVILFVTLEITSAFDPAFCYDSYYSVISLIFAAVSISFAFLLFAQSFIRQSVEVAVKNFPYPSGVNVDYYKSYNRAYAVSNVGYSLIMLAFGWITPYGDGRVWDHFALVLGAGTIITVSCKIWIWVKLKPYREMTVQTYGMTSVTFGISSLIILLFWPHNRLYFDTVAFVILYSACNIASSFIVFFFQMNSENNKDSG
jgi:hypothetical protein